MSDFTLLQQLARPFPVSKLKWRKGAGNMELVYLSAQQYQSRLDDVMGMDWQCEYNQLICCDGAAITACRVGLKIDGEWVWRSSGAGETNIEGEKGVFTDAFKRACSAWGIGRYLYAGFNKENIPVWATPEGYDELILKRNESE